MALRPGGEGWGEAEGHEAEGRSNFSRWARRVSLQGWAVTVTCSWPTVVPALGKEPASIVAGSYLLSPIPGMARPSSVPLSAQDLLPLGPACL